MLCPNCRTRLDQDRLGEQIVECCAACQGIWLDEGELAKGVSDWPGSHVAPASMQAPSDRRCPRCAAVLTTQQYAHDSGAWIARCKACRGQWIDSDQIARLADYLRSSPPVDVLAETLGRSFQQQRRRELAYEWLTNKWLSGAVALL